MDKESTEKKARPKSRQSLAHVPSKSNTTTDLSALRRQADEETKNQLKRSRGKSLGPGGLEALTESNSNVFKAVSVFQPKSILKPVIPLTPPKAIPSFDELKSRNTGQAKSPLKSGPDDLLIDFSTPGANRAAVATGAIPGTDSLVDLFAPDAPPAQHAQAIGDEEDRQRRERKKAAMEQRAARRKSMANRRVSFAPEATLHTWSVMELLEDSTTSSASNSTRRQSAMSTAQTPKLSSADVAAPNERPMTPTEQQNDEVVSDTPDSQRELHQRKRRRTSDNTQSDEDDTFSSPGDGVGSSPIRIEEDIDCDSDTDTDGDTAMSLDDITQNTAASSESSSTQNSLEERLRQAASQAGTKGISHDEHGSDLDMNDDEDGDQTMDLADGTVTHAFRQYARKPSTTSTDPHLASNNESILYPHLDLIGEETPTGSVQDDGGATMGMTMDVTRAMGGIVSQASNETSQQNSHSQSSLSQRESSGLESSYDDETMDMTVAKGGILSQNVQTPNGHHSEDSADEEVTMEMTKAIGGINAVKNLGPFTFSHTEETEAMDMTMAAGGILPPIEEQTEPQSVIEGELTTAMDMTRALGAILPLQDVQNDELTVTAAMEMTRAIGSILPSEFFSTRTENVANMEIEEVPSPSAQLKEELGRNVDIVEKDRRSMAPAASETGSPALKPRLSARKSSSAIPNTTPKSNRKSLSPSRTANCTPSKQLTPAPARGTSPRRTPILTANVTTRSASPKKLFAKEIAQRSSPASRTSPKKQADLLFSRDDRTGQHTPKVVLHAPKPHQHLRRKSSTAGLAHEGTGSPTVSDLLSRRQSIGDSATSFQLQRGQKRQVGFEDPKQLEHEVDAERAEEHRRESGRFIMEQEASQEQDENTTQNLKDLIQSMTPRKEKKQKPKSRKSLAVGSARGLLGKRPAELDLDEEEEEEDDPTPKRLKTVSREGSPVKKVHLPKPPSKEETTGRLTRHEQLALANGSTNTPTMTKSPTRTIQSPATSGRFKILSAAERPTSFEERLDNVIGATDIETTHPEIAANATEEKVSLQEFLNMTNIHFIELSTTKRRHTLARANDNTLTSTAENSSQACFVAAASTLPMLELYQHATRELKSYISSGRGIIRQIEADTLAEQPPIFKEYLDARPDIKIVMDNQFRNGKTNARLQSKEGWYLWRGQLVDGLRTGLEGIQSEMSEDKKILDVQLREIEKLTSKLLPQKQQLEQDLETLQKHLEDVAISDHNELIQMREALRAIDAEVIQKSSRVDKLQTELKTKRDNLTAAAELHQEMHDQISEATRVQEEQRQWPVKEVTNYKRRVASLEQRFGWQLLAAEEPMDDLDNLGVTLTLLYRGQLKLSLRPSALEPKREMACRRSGRNSKATSDSHAGICLVYQPSEEDQKLPRQLSNELQFFLQKIQGQLHSMLTVPQGSGTYKSVLRTVSNGWSLAEQVAAEVSMLQSAGIVRTTVIGDDVLEVRLMLTQRDRSRIDISFTCTVTDLDHGAFDVATAVTARPVYGAVTKIMDASKTRKIQQALSKEIESKTLGKASWFGAVRGFEDWLQAQTQPKEETNLRPKPSAKTATMPPSQPMQEPVNPETVKQQRRAVTASPRQTLTSTTPKVPPRSPLAPKTTNARVQKKALPVPKKAINFTTALPDPPSMIPQATSFRDSTTQPHQTNPSKDRENLIPTTAKNQEAPISVGDQVVFTDHENMSYDDVFGLKNGIKPAIAPEVQEAMMHTPVKRRAGALRRSPV